MFFEAVSEDGAQLASSRGDRYGAKRFLVASVIAIGCSLRNPWTLSPRGLEYGVARPGTVHESARWCTSGHERRQCLSEADIRLSGLGSAIRPQGCFA